MKQQQAATPEQRIAKAVIVSAETFNLVLQYLYQKPFAEALPLVQRLQASTAVFDDAPTPDVPPTPPAETLPQS